MEQNRNNVNRLRLYKDGHWSSQKVGQVDTHLALNRQSRILSIKIEKKKVELL